MSRAAIGERLAAQPAVTLGPGGDYVAATTSGTGSCLVHTATELTTYSAAERAARGLSVAACPHLDGLAVGLRLAFAHWPEGRP